MPAFRSNDSESLRTARWHLVCAVALGVVWLTPTLGAAEEVPDIAGRYEVTGTTVDRETNEKREISGMITIVQEGATFTSHSEFKTLTPGSDIVPAKVLGTGTGEIQGNKLTGTGENQLQSSSVPGLDVDFGMIPHQKVSQRIQSKWNAEIQADGTIKLESDNTAAEGEEGYSPTTTTLEGKRISDAPGT